MMCILLVLRKNFGFATYSQNSIVFFTTKHYIHVIYYWVLNSKSSL